MTPWKSLVFGVLLCFATHHSFAQGTFQLSLHDASTWPGGAFDVPVILDSSAGDLVTGWSWGVCHDSTQVVATELMLGAAAAATNGGAGPDFLESFIIDNGWTTGAVISFLGLDPLPPATDHELMVASYMSLQEGSSNLSLCTLGAPPIEVHIISGGMQVTPSQVGSTVTSEVTELFRFTAPDVAAGYDIDSGLGSFCADFSIQDILAPADAVQGFSMGLSHTPGGLVAVSSVTATGMLAALNGGSGPDFLAASVHTEGWTVGVVCSFLDTSALSLAASEPLISTCYSTTGLLAGDPDGETVQLIWVDTLGTPAVVNEVLVGGQVFNPSFVDGSVTLQPSTGTPFVRGDCNSDGAYDIADAVRLLEGLFGLGVTFACPAACDANGDTARDLADAIYLLSFVVSAGPPPPAPSGACGGDGGIDCVFSACP